MEDYLEFEEIQIGSVSCLGKEGVPVWGIIHYLEQTCLNHMKLTTVQRICELSARGTENCRFLVAASSAEIFPSESLLDSTFRDYVVMADNEKSPDSFWKVISSYKRPVVFYNNGNRKIPLYDFTYPEAVRITSFTEQSPFQVDAKGAVGALIDLVYAGEREERARQIFLNEQIGQSARNIEAIVRASAVISNSNVPEGVRRYAEQQLINCLGSQAKLNEKVGINQVTIRLDGQIDVKG